MAGVTSRLWLDTARTAILNIVFSPSPPTCWRREENVPDCEWILWAGPLFLGLQRLNGGRVGEKMSQNVFAAIFLGWKKNASAGLSHCSGMLQQVGLDTFWLEGQRPWNTAMSCRGRRCCSCTEKTLWRRKDGSIIHQSYHRFHMRTFMCSLDLHMSLSDQISIRPITCCRFRLHRDSWCRHRLVSSGCCFSL